MILLDTHTWLWLLHDPTQLSDPAQTIITEAENNNRILEIYQRLNKRYIKTVKKNLQAESISSSKTKSPLYFIELSKV